MATSASLVHGDVSQNGYSDDIRQIYSDTCAIKSQQIILSDFGIDYTEDQLVQYSLDHGWYNGNGTQPQDVGKILIDAGIPCTQKEHANIFNLVNELSQGHKVIVGVDADELWNNDSLLEKTKNWLADFWGENPNHALIVAGIDTTDPNNIQVIVKDPGTGDDGKAYPIEQFMNAWADSSCFMVATDCAVPTTVQGMENFDLNLGHIDNVAGVPFTDFQVFNNLSYGLPSYPIFDNNGMMMSPMSSLVNGYFDYAHNDIMFNQLFNNPNYMFNDYMTHQAIIDNVLPQMGGTFDMSMNYINFSPTNDWNHFMAENNILSFSNIEYGQFLDQSILDFQSMGDFQSVMYCEQQHMLLDFCNHYGFSFYDSFMI